MAQTFKWPNLVAATDEWSDWFSPVVGGTNSTFKFHKPEELELREGQIVCTSVELEFDGFWIDTSTDPRNALLSQGAVDDAWHIPNVIMIGLFLVNFATPTSGRRTFSHTYVVNRSVVKNYGSGPHRFSFGMRCDGCGGGASGRVASWSPSTATGSPTRGRRRKVRCGLSE